MTRYRTPGKMMSPKKPVPSKGFSLPKTRFVPAISCRIVRYMGTMCFFQDSRLLPDEGRPMREAAPGSRRPVSPSCLPHAPRNLAFKNGRMHPAIFRAPIPANNFPHGNWPSDEGASSAFPRAVHRQNDKFQHILAVLVQDRRAGEVGQLSGPP